MAQLTLQAQRGARSRGSAAWAVLGALSVLVGVQMPALEIELLGAVSFLDIGGAPGTVLVCAAIGALFAVVTRQRSWLALCALTLWIALLWPALRAGYERLVPPERSALAELGDALGQAVGRAFTDDLLQVTGLRAGCFVLLAGCVLVSVGAFRGGRR